MASPAVEDAPVPASPQPEVSDGVPAGRGDLSASGGDHVTVPAPDGALSGRDAVSLSGEEFVSVHAGMGAVCGLRANRRLECAGWSEEALGGVLDGEFLAVSVGHGFGCGVRVRGSLVCWGDPPRGLVPPPPGEFVTVAASHDQVCAARSSGGVACWGDRYADGVTLPEGDFAALSVGWYVSCGIRAGGEAVCWSPDSAPWSLAGRFESIAVGRVPFVAPTCAVRVGGEVACYLGADPVRPSAARFSSVDVGDNYACGLRIDGSLQCWGQRTPGECRGGIDALSMEHAPCWGWEAYPGFAPTGPYTDLSVAVSPLGGFAAQICAVRSAGDVVCWNDGSEVHVPPAGAFVELDASSDLTCGLRPDGSATCWGMVSWAHGVVEPQWTPAVGRFVSLSVGAEHACGLRADGDVLCWGVDSYGETRAPDEVFTMVSAGMHLSCGRRADGEAACWGTNQWWEAAPPQGPFDAVYAGDEYACGIRPGGRAECWGRDRGDGALSPPGEFASLHLAGRCGVRTDGELTCWGEGASVPELLPAGPFTALTGQADRGCALRRGGEVSCWGGFADWAPVGTFRTISDTSGPMCGIRLDDTLECRPGDWPRAEQARRPLLGSDAVAAERVAMDNLGPRARWTRSLQPEGIPDGLHWVRTPLPGGPFIGLSSGGRCGIRSDGAVDCWGEVEPLLDSSAVYESVVSGFGYWCGIGPGGVLDCAGGVHPYRPVGSTDRWDDEHPPPAGRFGAVAVGVNRACAIHRVDGRIICWGPDADAEEHRPASGTYAAISIGTSVEQAVDMYIDYYQHTCAVSRDGDAVCWGDNHNGQTRVPPARLAAGPYLDIAAGGEHTCALRSTGAILCWGDNRYGQTEAPTGTHTAVTAGRWHTCALGADGEAVCWGDGVARQHIDPPPGTPNTRPAAGSFTAISAGDYHTCALRADGDVACWYSY